MARLLDGTAPDATPLELALLQVVRAAYEAPARMTPADLDAVRALAGDGAVDYAFVLGSFHFINRIADLLHVDAEALPAPLRRFEPLRRLSVRIAARLLSRMDLARRTYDASFEAVAARFGADATAFAPVRTRPKLVEALALAVEERDRRSTLDRATMARVHATVEAALPRDPSDVEGFHPRPPDPVEAFAFVGTRYAYRTTREMIDALRQAGFDDVGLLDLATAVADANNWARLHRLLGLSPDLYYVGPARLASPSRSCDL